MVLKRYLIYFSYIGTSFRGVQRQTTREVDDPTTVQGLMEHALDRMKLKNKPTTALASRTDRGVHALKSALTVDLDFVTESKPIQIHHYLNRFFHNTDVPIRVIDVLLVSNKFNCRKAPLWRQYVYRFAILKPNHFPEDPKSLCTFPIPITEYNRCLFVTNSNFDYEAVKKTTEIFVGPQDFITFLGKPNSCIHGDNLITARCLHEVSVEPAVPYIPSSLNDCFDYYHLTCKGRSFIYNQVRNIVTVLLAVGQGKLTIDYVQRMFTDPTPDSWPRFLEMVPADGLYLTDICYDPKDLAEDTNDDSNQNLNLQTPDEELEKKKQELKDRLETKLENSKQLANS